METEPTGTAGWMQYSPYVEKKGTFLPFFQLALPCS